ncbi:MAG: lactate utilization protein [Anaerolineae bacterium]|jgi:L-lactate dehydrogenase complex protein LldG|nr:lactate utilization protein [Anaerolineae bacterium]
MSARDKILAKLRAAQTPFTDVPPIGERLRVTPDVDPSPEGLKARFIKQAELVSVKICPVDDDVAAVAQIMALIGDDSTVMAWDFDQIGLSGLESALTGSGVRVTDPKDGGVRVGITGVEVALAVTGSLVVSSGAGRSRAASLLPPVHVAVVRAAQIIPDLEAYFERLRAQPDGAVSFRQSANVVVITGSSRTADIGQELILGAHGPVSVQVVLIG